MLCLECIHFVEDYLPQILKLNHELSGEFNYSRHLLSLCDHRALQCHIDLIGEHQ